MKQDTKLDYDADLGEEVDSHQEFALLFPVVALGVGGHVGLSDDADQLPFLLRWLRSLPHHLLHFLTLPPLTVLLNQLPFGQTLAVIQHH